MIRRYLSDVRDNLLVSWVVPTAGVLALCFAALIMMGVAPSLMYVLLRLDAFWLVLYFAFRYRADVENLRDRRRGERPDSDEKHTITPLDNRRSVVLGVLIAGGLLIAMSLVGRWA